MKHNLKDSHLELLTGGLTWFCLAILVVGVVAGLGFQIEAINFRYPLDYGEAPVLNQAVLLGSGESIYRADLGGPPYTIANYPPVYVSVLALFEIMFGPAFWYGRLISVLSAAGSAIFIFLILNSRSHYIKYSLLPSFLFLNIPYVLNWSILARIDHLALFFALGGLYFLFRKNLPAKRIDGDFILGSLFLVLAIYTRQSYALAAPMAAFLYLIQKQWKRGLLLVAVVGGGSLIVFIILNLCTSGGFYFNIVTANINAFGLDRLIQNFQNFFEEAPVIFILAALSMVLVYRRVSGWPMVIGFALGGFLSALTIGKIGSNVNYFLELTAAMCLLIGFGLVVLAKEQNRWFNIAALCTALILLSLQSVRFIQTVQNSSRNELNQRKAASESLETMDNLVRQNSEALILADEYMGMAVLNGQELYLQPFEITQLTSAGLFDQEPLLEQIRQDVFPVILIQDGSWWETVAQERWTPEMLEAIKTHYRATAQLDNTSVYKPRTRQATVVDMDCPAGAWALPSNAYLGYQYDDGLLVLYSAGAEGAVPVVAPADGIAFRPAVFPEGSVLLVIEDPLNAGERVILLFTDMLSYTGQEDFIAETLPAGAEAVMIQQGDLIGYQAKWAGTPFNQKWLHVNIGMAPYAPELLMDYEALLGSLINPEDHFGIQINETANKILPVECQFTP